MYIYIYIYTYIYICICSKKDKRYALKMCPPGCCQSTNGLMVTHSLEHMMHGYTFLVPINSKSAQQSKQVKQSYHEVIDKFVITGRAHCHIICLFDYIYITLILLL